LDISEGPLGRIYEKLWHLAPGTSPLNVRKILSSSISPSRSADAFAVVGRNSPRTGISFPFPPFVTLLGSDQARSLRGGSQAPVALFPSSFFFFIRNFWTFLLPFVRCCSLVRVRDRTVSWLRAWFSPAPRRPSLRRVCCGVDLAHRCWNLFFFPLSRILSVVGCFGVFKARQVIFYFVFFLE